MGDISEFAAIDRLSAELAAARAQIAAIGNWQAAETLMLNRIEVLEAQIAAKDAALRGMVNMVVNAWPAMKELRPVKDALAALAAPARETE